MPNEGDAWSYTLDQLDASSSGAAAVGEPPATAADALGRALLAAAAADAPPPRARLVGTYLDTARLLGQRTAELHRALASDHDDPAFAPEPFTTLYQRSLYQSLRNGSAPDVPAAARRLAVAARRRRAGCRCAILEPRIGSRRGFRALLERAARRPGASASTATTTSARCSTPAATS